MFLLSGRELLPCCWCPASLQRAPICIAGIRGVDAAQRYHGAMVSSTVAPAPKASVPSLNRKLTPYVPMDFHSPSCAYGARRDFYGIKSSSDSPFEAVDSVVFQRGPRCRLIGNVSSA